ncbi:hypothetical protein [Bacillus mycoides]|uniref:DUF262 domain-containing protein n=1 Tax=Bacillus mycoides TaxID=1405 RepID=A0A1E8BBI6_BACMY|nr:hypothetical protein [Bacillus mycoides]OFD82691.1 hypothetical protein BWGOE8_12760 [Bacillus mycoides]OFD83075.1 hypothetical protein BWGOE9_12430 [Bacillus mycoides]OFD85506.1 hypothetical protein BWGOE10_12580 [Bacillus mycoides]
MEIKSRITDSRISAENIFIEMTYEEYLKIASKIIENNPLQRRRVKSSNTVYSLLKNDLKSGCLMPPMVLGLSNGRDNEYATMSDDELIKYINDNKERLIILDGLQRTHTLKDVEIEYESTDSKEAINAFYSNKLRLELYLGINKFGILYRMLTLNTGQTPMSIRHQIEMLYQDYLQFDIEGIKILREVDENNNNELGTYNFKSVIEGFNSYLERDPLPMDRFDVLNNVKSLEKLSIEDQKQDLFMQYLITFNLFIKHVVDYSADWQLDTEYEEEMKLSSRAFAVSALKLFNKSQAFTGFGAAIGKLRDLDLISGFEEVNKIIPNLTSDENQEDWIIDFIINLDEIKRKSKKIGNSQREYFYWFFRALFNKDSDAYLNLSQAVEDGYKKYRRESE